MKLIDKLAVVAEIDERIKAHKETLKNCDSSISEMILKGSMSAYQSLLHFLDTLEVKEVDFEKIWKEYFKYRGDVATVNVKHLAKHFFELGLKSQSVNDTILEEIDKVLSNPRKFINPDKSVEECMLDEITKIIQEIQRPRHHDEA